MSNYPFIQTIRYMGNKNKLLDFIIPEIESLTDVGDYVCDIMAGTNCIGYALKGRNRTITNDIQFYSFVIAKCLLGNYPIPDLEEVKQDIEPNFAKNKEYSHFHFFIENYTDTYFSQEQCSDIDSLRYAIEKVADENRKFFYLTLLMSAMCKAQSTPGHFAQYLNKDSKRVQPLRRMSIKELFYSKIDDFSEFVLSKFESNNFNFDYNELFKLPLMQDVKCFYLDSPYTSDQYSRFYHLLETVCKYDNPHLRFKAKYRDDRVLSNFCYKHAVLSEFEKIISFCSKNGSSLLISYSNHGVVSIEEIKAVAEKYYQSVEMKYCNYDHSSQGKGTIKIQEVLFILKGRKTQL